MLDNTWGTFQKLVIIINIIIINLFHFDFDSVHNTQAVQNN